MTRSLLMRRCAALGVVALLLLAGGCGGDSTVKVGVPGDPTGPVITGQVSMPNGQVAADASLLERVAAVVVARAEALFAANVRPVDSGVEVRLRLISAQNIQNGQIHGGRIIFRATTGADGRFGVRLPADTTPNTCRFLLEVGSGRNLTRAFVDDSDVPINFESEATVRLLLAQIKQRNVGLCGLSAAEIRGVRLAVENSDLQVVGDDAAAVNRDATAVAATDPAVQAAIAAAIGQATPVPSNTATAQPTLTETAGVPPTSTVPPTNTVAAPTRTRTNTAVSTRTGAPTRTPTPIPTDTTGPTNTAVRTSTQTTVPTNTSVPTNTVGATATRTSLPTNTLALPTITATALPTGTATATLTPGNATPTNTIALPPTATATVPPTASATVPPTASATLPPTATATATIAVATPTATTSSAQVNLGTVAGTAGGTVVLPATLESGGAEIAAAANEIDYTAAEVDVVLNGGDPDCTVDARLDGVKQVLASVSDLGGGRKRLRVGVIGTDNNTAITSGPLYSCRFAIALGAPGIVVLENTPEAAGRQANPIAVLGSDGRIDVGAAPPSLGLSAGTAASGQPVEITATLNARGTALAAVATDIAFDPAQLSVVEIDDAPDCTVTAPVAAAGKGLVAMQLSAGGQTVLRVGVLGSDNNTSLPEPGAPLALFTCRFVVQVAGTTIELSHAPEGASPAAQPIALVGDAAPITVP